MKTKVVVTGGAGFIGSNLVNELVRQGFEVHIIDLLAQGVSENISKEVQLNNLDVSDLDKIEKVFIGAKYVFHLAALPRVQYSIEHPWETQKTNIAGTLAVLMSAHKEGVKRVIYSASSSVYGDQEKMPLREDMPAMPKSPYGLEKYVAELYCRLWSEVYDLPTVSLRYFNVYGPGHSDVGAYALVIAKFLKQKREGKPLTITGDGDQTRDFTHVRDVVRANILAMKSDKVGKGEVINIGSGKNYSVKKIAELIGGQVEHIAPRLEPKHTLADNSLARELLGWEPQVSLEDGIAELVVGNG